MDSYLKNSKEVQAVTGWKIPQKTFTNFRRNGGQCCRRMVEQHKIWRAWYCNILSFYSNITTIQFGIKIIPFYLKSTFLKSLATRFEQITSVHYIVISHTENKNLQFFVKSKKLCKIQTNWSQKSTVWFKQCE